MKRNTHHNLKIAQAGLFFSLLMCILSCKKQDDWLNAKRSLSDVVPTTLKDLQAVLDNDVTMNGYYPVLTLLGTDNSYVTDDNLNGASQVERNSYIWAKDIFQGQPSDDWSTLYQRVEYTNIVLEGLQNINPNADPVNYNNVKGGALFYRSMAFYELAQIFCKPYNAASANTDLGIPIKLSSDIHAKATRSTLQQTYTQILNDLNTAVNLLPVKPLHTTRPSQVSANALLAKIYLDMRDYSNAGVFADKSLSSYNILLDYNSSLVDPTTSYKFPSFATGNPEVIYYAECTGYNTIFPGGTGYVDTVLYKSYNDNDLRKSLFYLDNGGGLISFVGGYSGADGYNFGGIAVDEVYLIRAESYARAGNTKAAMVDLNTLLVKRWITGTFVPYTAVSSTDALTQILTERRKELPFTSINRWEDLRRLNIDPHYAVTVTHKYNGATYTLPPNDKRYVYPIPDQDVQLYNLKQNDR